MPHSSKAPDEHKQVPAEADKDGGKAPGGNSIQDASDEAISFMEEGDEPGHAGHGDGG